MSQPPRTPLLAGAIDISILVVPGQPVYPGECLTAREVHLAPTPELPVTCQHWHLTAHAGTHLDAPRHFNAAAPAIADYPASFFEFRTLVLDASGLEGHVDAAFLEQHRAALADVDAVLFRTHDGSLWNGPFQHAHRAIGHDAAAVLAAMPGLRLIGIDYFSVEPFGATPPRTHMTLQAAEKFIMEGIDLAAVTGGVHTMLCLPIRWEGAEAAPCRAVLLPV